MRSPIAIAAATAVLLLGGCATSHHSLLGQARPAIPVEQVKVYQVAPQRYEEIARVDATSAVGFGTQGQETAAIERLRREAAKLGANGVMILGSGTVGSPVGVGVGGASYGSHGGVGISGGIPTAQRHVEGVAIYVIEE